MKPAIDLINQNLQKFNLKTILQGRPMGHPLHPFLVHLPIGFYTASFLFDFLGLLPRSLATKAFDASASYTLIGMGLFFSVFAVVAGVADFVDIPQGSMTQKVALAHAGVNALNTVGYISQLIARRNSPTVSLLAFAWNFMQFSAMLFAGWLGGKLVFQLRMGARPVQGLNNLFASNPQNSTENAFVSPHEEARANLREAVNALKPGFGQQQSQQQQGSFYPTVSDGTDAGLQSFQAIPDKSSLGGQNVYQRGAYQPIAG